MTHPVIQNVTNRIIERSKAPRQGYLDACKAQMRDGPRRKRLSEGNIAHASAGCSVMEKTELLGAKWPNIGIITAYNDMLSAHQPFERSRTYSPCRPPQWRDGSSRRWRTRHV